MSRRASGEGLIRQRSNGLWEARYVGADGRKHSLYGRTKRDATDRLRAAITEARQGILPVDQRLTTAAYLSWWLETVRETNRPSTHASYADVVRRYITPRIGRIALAKLQPDHVSGMLRDIRKERPDLSATTVRYVYTVLRIALGRAVKVGKAHRNVATLIDPPTRVRREVEPMSADEARTFLGWVAERRPEPEAAGPIRPASRHEALYRVAITAGLRQGELLGLRWQDVDLDGAALTVRHALSNVTGELGDPKTDTGRRTVGLEDSTVAALRAHRTRQARDRLAAGSRWTDLGYVFASSNGTPIQARNLIRDYHRDLVAAGVAKRTFHSLRHACATLLLEHGEEIANVSKLLGHSSLATTADFYGHLTPRISRRAADRMRDILAG